jgi:hypothetical protein
MDLNPSATRSLEEGMEETLTVHRLRVPAQLRRTLASTNVIESAFSIVETVCRNVKRWRAGDHIERWVGSGLLVAERQFRKVQGYREIPALLTALANAVSRKSVAEFRGSQVRPKYTKRLVARILAENSPEGRPIYCFRHLSKSTNFSILAESHRNSERSLFRSVGAGRLSPRIIFRTYS